MDNNYLLFYSLWCPLEDIRSCIEDNRRLLKEMIDFIRDYGDDEGITFLELTEDSLKSLPGLMVDNMKCFNKQNIDTVAYGIKEISSIEENIEALKNFFEESTGKLVENGFRAEILIIKVVKIEEENIGKTVGKKNYDILFHKQFI